MKEKRPSSSRVGNPERHTHVAVVRDHRIEPTYLSRCSEHIRIKRVADRVPKGIPRTVASRHRLTALLCEVVSDSHRGDRVPHLTALWRVSCVKAVRRAATSEEIKEKPEVPRSPGSSARIRRSRSVRYRGRRTVWSTTAPCRAVDLARERRAVFLEILRSPLLFEAVRKRRVRKRSILIAPEYVDTVRHDYNRAAEDRR